MASSETTMNAPSGRLELRISARLAIGFGLMIALASSIAVFSAWKMSTLASSVNVVASDRLNRIAMLQEIRNNLNGQGL